MPEILKVTDPKKIVTDPVLLRALTEQGIDKDYVELWHDYAPKSTGEEYSPYAQFYRDLKANKRFMVVSGLPMVDADGFKIEVGWRVAGINYFSEKNNLFRARVQGTDVELTIRNNQPDGRKVGDKLTYKPQLFLDGVEQTCGNSSLLPVDPVNPNYLENTLEWDYGICKRRLRIIEGSILGSWVFASKPTGEIRIKYNQFGDYKLKLGQFKVTDDEEVVRLDDFDNLIAREPEKAYPITIHDQITLSSGVEDGMVNNYNGAASYISIHDAATGHECDKGYLYYTHENRKQASGNIFLITRIFIPFDTSGIGAGKVVSAVSLSLYNYTYGEAHAGHADTVIQAGTQGAVLAIEDYDAFNAPVLTPTTIAIEYPPSEGAYIDTALIDANADGFGYISRTGESYFCVRALGDYSAIEPPSVGNNYCYFWSNEKGNGYKPKLVVTYTTGWANIAKVSGVAASAISKVNGVAAAAISKVNGVSV